MKLLIFLGIIVLWFCCSDNDIAFATRMILVEVILPIVGVIVLGLLMVPL